VGKHADKYSFGERKAVFKAINKSLGAGGKPLWDVKNAVKQTVYWLDEAHRYAQADPSIENVCRQLYLNYRNTPPLSKPSRDIISAMLRLQCVSAIPQPGISHDDMVLIYQAVDHEVDPGVPVSLDFWLNSRERDDLCYVLMQYKKYRADADSQERLAYLRGHLCQGDQAQAPTPAAPKPRTEGDRMRDFFFGKKSRSGLMGLPSWGRKR
jgi:hypothetical protein